MFQETFKSNLRTLRVAYSKTKSALRAVRVYCEPQECTTSDIWAIPRCRTYVSDTYFMPGALTGNETYIKLLLFHTHHLIGTFEYFVSFTHIGYEPKYGWCRTYAHKLLYCEKKISTNLSESLDDSIKMWPDTDRE